MKKALLLFSVILLLSNNIFSQSQRKEIAIPDILEYKTLKCDFHMHTVFSDGSVWPNIRVEEAWREGLDAIAITEHVEYHPHNKDLSKDIYRSYLIAKPKADAKGIILVKGAEITRSMPPGHFNALFIEDYDTLNQPGWYESIKAAKDQGAFIFWNHPGWRQKDEIPIWYKEHSQLYNDEMFSGIEIANEKSYYPLSYQWAVDSNLTVLGNSDIHSPINMDYDIRGGEHRNMTLVFATEKTEKGIREALFAGRTAVYYKDLLIGKQEFLEGIFNNSVFYKNDSIPPAGKTLYVNMHNHSDLPLKFEILEKPEGVKCSGNFTIEPHSTVLYSLSIIEESKAMNEIYLTYEIKNLLTGPENYCKVELKFKQSND
ncbi:Sb-PDE family phosphodiesterase [Bacteroidota bacterium]